ncbi:MAG: YiiX/YebB-like N1pC/P60 family cysteine hydrolase [Pseudobdellovibrio sp.]
MKILLVLAVIFSGVCLRAADFSKVVEGDVIFQKSQSSQSAAIQEASGSPWSHVGLVVKNNGKTYVAEAVQPVRLTPIDQFIARGRGKEFIIKRFAFFDSEKMTPSLYSVIRKYIGKNYDIYFEFSDDRIYCSELIYKVFQEVTGQEVGVVQKFKDMRLDGPYIQRLIQERLTSIGKELNLEEPIITPISQLKANNMMTVLSSPGASVE